MIELARELGLALANSCEFVQMKQAQSDFEQNEAIAQLTDEGFFTENVAYWFGA